MREFIVEARCVAVRLEAARHDPLLAIPTQRKRRRRKARAGRELMGDRKQPTPLPNPPPRKPEPPPAPPRKCQIERAIIRTPERPDLQSAAAVTAPQQPDFVPHQCTGTCRALLRTKLDAQLHRCDPISVVRRESVMERGA